MSRVWAGSAWWWEWGGLGKTQLAIEYVHRFAMCYPGGIFWIDVKTGILDVVVQVSQGAPGMVVDETAAAEVQLQQLWRKLASFPPVLVVLDNFPEAGPLGNWLPPAGTIHVLVTTRRRDLQNYTPVPLDIMTPEEGLRLLNSGHRQLGEEGKTLVDILGGLPLALELTRNYLNIREDITPEVLVAQIRERGELRTLKYFTDAYEDELPSGHEKEIAATIEMSWNMASDPAKAVLRAISFLAPVPVPRRLLRIALDFTYDDLFKDPLAEALAELHRKLSLVDLDNNGDPFAHRLISGFVRETASDAVHNIYNPIVAAVENEIARAQDEKYIASYRELEKVLPHAEFLVDQKHIDPKQAITIAGSVVWHHRNLGRYRLSEKFGKKALSTAQKIFDPGHPSIAGSQSNLALVLKDLGELEEARDLLREAYQSFLKKFGSEHPYTKIVKRNNEAIDQQLYDS